jgi:hypothetical protein
MAAAVALLGTVTMGGCDRHAQPVPAYAPGLGEIMTLTQMRHAKLWLAGAAGNWELASYETDELEEGFHDAVAFHPVHKDSPVPLAQVLPALVDAPIAALRASIGQHDKAAFETAFDALTAACNDCHQTMKFGFNVVQRPAASPFPNQDFAPPSGGLPPP